jgi:hypothetical protein
LDLLADFLQLGLAKNDALRNRGVIRLSAEGVQFAENFLGNELQRPADWFMSTEVMGELREMAFHPRELFRNVSAIREERDFFYQPLVVR